LDVSNLTILLAIAVFAPALAGCLLLLSWLQHRRVKALAIWGSAFITAAVAATLIIIARGRVPDFWSIVLGNALLAAAYGLLWYGARMFDEKRAPVGLGLAGVIVWLIACSIGPLYAEPENRATTMAAIGIVYTLLTAFELWRGRSNEIWRWPIIIVLLLHAVAIPIRVPLAGALKHPGPSDLDLLTLAIFEWAFVCICTAYLFGGLAKDRIAARYREASLADPLTGVANRRGFFHSGQRLLMRARFAREPTALIMFDLDRFKTINDEFGHEAGDKVLVAFCRLAIAQLRAKDLFGRIGGEEFVTLLPQTTREDALRLAERVRAAAESASLHLGEHSIPSTVSAGVALTDNSATDLPGLLRRADHALYRAKAGGGNRVEASSSVAEQALMRRPDKLSAA
jgi:diguanylate cyclase (GGDEF)-like protein